MVAAGLEGSGSLLFQSLTRGRRTLTVAGMTSRDGERMLARRAGQARVAETLSPHSVRSRGIAAYLQNGGTLEHAQHLAVHASLRTTRLHDSTADQFMLDNVERLRF